MVLTKLYVYTHLRVFVPGTAARALTCTGHNEASNNPLPNWGAPTHDDWLQYLRGPETR